MQVPKQAVILAAGSGSRLDPQGLGLPKCLQPVGGRPLLEHHLRMHRHLGIERTLVIGGAKNGLVRSWLADCVDYDYIESERFLETNSLYSLWLAREWVRGPFLLQNCDLIGHPSIFRALVAAEGSALAYDSTHGQGEEEMKVAIDPDGRLLAMSKGLKLEFTKGENLGILKFGEHAVGPLFEAADELIQAGKEKSWAPAAVSRIAGDVPIRCVDVARMPWTEIDFPEDLERARQVVWPVIQPSMMAIDVEQALLDARPVAIRIPLLGDERVLATVGGAV